VAPMILLIYFDRVLGPRIFASDPPQLVKDMETTHLEQIKSLLDTNAEGFFAHNFSPEFKTANYIFTVESEFARGGSELLMLTIIISEEEPDYNFYESILKKFTTKIKGIKDLFKIFYERKDLQDKTQSMQIIKNIHKDLADLSRIVAIKSIETEGHLLDFKEFQAKKLIEISDRIVNKVAVEGKKNIFVVSRTREDGIKIDLIPVNKDKIIKLSVIFNENTTIMVVQEVSKILSQFKEYISLVFTSGVCQEQNRCIYEVYITSERAELDKIIAMIQNIPGVLSVESNDLLVE
jgi:hypothetical protein